MFLISRLLIVQIYLNMTLNFLLIEILYISMVFYLVVLTKIKGSLSKVYLTQQTAVM
jgi:hypothetical protein